MKKRIIASVATVLAAATALLSGCGSDKAKTDLIEKESGAVESIIAGWDSEADFGYFGATEAFGITRLNTDKTYVSQGEGSMYVTVEGNYELLNFPGKYNDRKPFIRLFTQDIMHNTDFSKAESFAIDVYNVSDRPVSIGLRFKTATGRGDYGAQMQIVTEQIPCVKDGWTTAEFVIDRARGAYQGFGAVSQLDIFFENRQSDQTPATLYLDNFRVRNAADEMKKANVPEAVSDTVIADYEDEWFTTTALAYDSVNFPALNSFYQPITARNENPDFVKSGSASLKIERRPYRYQDTALQSMAEVGLFGVEHLEKIDFAGKNAAATDIVMDVYNDYDYVIDYTLAISSGDIEVTKLFRLYPKTWNELRFPMDTTNASGDVVNYSNVIKFNARFYEHYGTNAVHYVDNVRFESRG